MADTSRREFLVRTADGDYKAYARSPFKAAVEVVNKRRPDLGATIAVADLGKATGYCSSEKVVTAAKARAKKRRAPAATRGDG